MGNYPNLANEVFTYLCVFRQPCEPSQAEAGWFPISFLLSGLTCRVGSLMPGTV